MKHTKHKRIPNSLRKYRRSRGLKQKEVAKILGLKSSCMISRWEKGHHLPQMVNIFKLAVLYHTMADALFTDLRRVLQEDILKAEKKLLKLKPQGQNAS